MGCCLALGTSVSSISVTACGLLPSPSGVNGGKNHIAGRSGRVGGFFKSIQKDGDSLLTLAKIRRMDDGLARDVGRTDGIRNGQVPVVAANAFRILN